MFNGSYSLVAEKNKYYRLKNGQSGGEVSSYLRFPVCGEAFAGRIICREKKYREYAANPCDSYKSLAAKFGVEEDELKRINGGRVIYPTLTLFIPADGE